MKKIIELSDLREGDDWKEGVLFNMEYHSRQHYGHC